MKKKWTLQLEKYIVIDFDQTPPRGFITTGQLTFLVDLYWLLYLELLLENSTESVILTIDEEKNELSCLKGT